MKRSVAILTIAALAGSAAAQTGYADYRSQDFPGNQGGGFNNGGVFNFRLSQGLEQYGDNWNGTDSYSTLKTFCIEIGENVGDGAAQINTDAIQGGRTHEYTVNGVEYDPIEAQTAYLFTQFKAGAGGDFGNDFSGFNEQRGMQLAIWYFEEGLGTFTDNGTALSSTWTESDGGIFTNSTVQALAAQYIWAATYSGWTDIGNVRALNIGGPDTWSRQDMLVMIPLPQAGALAGLGLAGMAIRRRRHMA